VSLCGTAWILATVLYRPTYRRPADQLIEGLLPPPPSPDH
jgi:hypothetical protein